MHWRNATIMIYTAPDLHTSKDSVNRMKKPCTFSSCHIGRLALLPQLCLRLPNSQISLSLRCPKSTQAQKCTVTCLFSCISALSEISAVWPARWEKDTRYLQTWPTEKPLLFERERENCYQVPLSPRCGLLFSSLKLVISCLVVL